MNHLKDALDRLTIVEKVKLILDRTDEIQIEYKIDKTIAWNLATSEFEIRSYKYK